MKKLDPVELEFKSSVFNEIIIEFLFYSKKCFETNTDEDNKILSDKGLL